MNRNHYRKWPVKAACCLQLMLALLPSCTDDPETNVSAGGKGGTATLELSLSVPPMVETRAVVSEAGAGSEARKAGFQYEMQVQTTGSAPTDNPQPATRATTSLKNIYAFLFTSDGAFNGRASLEVSGVGNLFLVFENIADQSAANGRLVVVANDGAATVAYTSSTAFADFSGTYTEFQNLQLTSLITANTNIPYVGTAEVSLSGGTFTTLPTVDLYRMLAEIRLTNSTFQITGGPTRYSIDLYRAGKNYFGTPAGYDGTGSAATDAERYLETAVAGENTDNNIWYVGENIQSESTAGAYIRLASDIGTEKNNRNPAIGEEYYIAGGPCYTYDVYLNDYALRRNTIYNITVSIDGNLADMEKLATTDPNVTLTSYAVEHAGLNIGRFGGASGYTSEIGEAPTVSGTYTKDLLLQPNTSGTTEKDDAKFRMKWSEDVSTLWQEEPRKYWDPTYTQVHIDQTFNNGLAYEYCYNLTIGGVPKGTWYFPSMAQLLLLWELLEILDKEYASSYYWNPWNTYNTYCCSTEYNNSSMCNLRLDKCSNWQLTPKNLAYSVRCVRDL